MSLQQKNGIIKILNPSSAVNRPNGKSHKKHRRSLAATPLGLSDTQSLSIIRDREAKIAALQKDVTSLTNKLYHLNKVSRKKHSISGQGLSTPKRSHKLAPYGNVVTESNNSNTKSSTLTHERSRMGRNASIATAQELNSLTCKEQESFDSQNKKLTERILKMFDDPAQHIAYLNSTDFCKDILKLASKIRFLFEAEPRVTFLQSPAYVFGDIHGNLEDLHFFSDNIWRLGMSLTAGNFVFLGDYVDRGKSCLECIAYLFSMKLLHPHKVFLLRGNHETRDVNGWEEHYGDRSFIKQCRDRFGDDLGYKVWEQINQVFDRMPLAAVIDQDIFCVHGGIPRPIDHNIMKGKKSRVQDILNVPKVAGINPPYEHEREHFQQIASDCIWSDPASDEQEINSVDPETGYGESLRGGGAICFGHKAVKNFLSQHGFSYIMRAHEAHADGVAVSKGGKVFTIFSTSKDHNQGNEAFAGCILVDFEQMQVINRSPAYQNQYVHRRDSVTIEKLQLSENEIEQRERLGLIVAPPEDDEEEFEEDEDWNDFEEAVEFGNDGDSSDEEHFTFSSRPSSVNPNMTISSPPPGNNFWNGRQEVEGSVDPAPSDSFEYIRSANVGERRSKRRHQIFYTIAENADEEARMEADESF